MSKNNIIKFPGNKTKEPAPKLDPKPEDASPLSNLTEDQQKAMQCIMSGMAFVFLGIKPTDSGADFFTSLHGDPTDLRNAQEHLPGVIERLYDRKGI